MPKTYVYIFADNVDIDFKQREPTQEELLDIKHDILTVLVSDSPITEISETGEELQCLKA